MRISDLDQITDEAIDLSQELAIDDPSQTFKITLLQLRDFLKLYFDGQFVNSSGDTMDGSLAAIQAAGRVSIGTGRTDNGISVNIVSDDASSSIEFGDGRGITSALRWLATSGNLELINLLSGNLISLSGTPGQINTNANISTSAPAPLTPSDFTHKAFVESLTIGYGLGASTLPTTGNLNTLRAPGFRRYNQDEGGSNGPAPYGSVIYFGDVSTAQGFSGWCSQIFIGTDGAAYYRASSVQSGSFDGSPWIRLDQLPAARGNSDIVTGGIGQVGTYGLLKAMDGQTHVATSVVSGSLLNWSSCNVHGAPVGVGSWKCLGHSTPGDFGYEVTLWIRIA